MYCDLTFDEMSIRKQEIWDPVEKVWRGRVGVPGYNNEVSSGIAGNAFMIQLVNIRERWKLPLGYFFVNALTAEQKAALLRTCIERLQETKVFVTSITFDGLSYLLDCSVDGLDITKINPVFRLNDQPICVFFDAVHMVKLVRNTFGEKLTLYDDNGEAIEWKYIKRPLDLQQQTQMHLANKLRANHVKYVHQKMKVKLATQLLSKSVADSIQFCRDVLKLENFRDSGATIRFIRFMNDIFDVLNSRTFNTFGKKRPLNPDNIEASTIFINQAINNLSSLKLSEKTLLIHSGRKTGFVGLIICLKNCLFLYEQLVATGELKFLPLYKFSQDHIELLFGLIRSKGGFNPNPNAVQLMGAYKRVFTHMQYTQSGQGNCTVYTP
jgi:DNA transposase THAP9